MAKCDTKGRDCIEDNAASHFNCSISCEGFFADVQFVEDILDNEEDFLAEEELNLDTTAMSEIIREELKRSRMKISPLRHGVS